MRIKGVHHVEFSVLEYEESTKFFDRMFGWLGYKSFWTLDIEYHSIYYMAKSLFFHSCIGIQPAKTGDKLNPVEHATGIHHIALWAKNRKQVDDFYKTFLVKNNIEVTDVPTEYPTYAPDYYAVFFNDPITGIHFELSYTPMLPSISNYFKWIRILKNIWKKHPEWKKPPWKEAMRKLPAKNEQA